MPIGERIWWRKDVTHIENDNKWSYSSGQRLGLSARLKEFARLYTYTKSSAVARAYETVAASQRMRSIVREHLDLELRGLKILDVGPGQMLRHMHCLAVDNDITGIDMDIIPQGLNPAVYLNMLRYNSATRVLKTLARKLLRVDARFETEMADQLGIPALKPLPVLRMDATHMTFADEHFDFVYSFSAFEHIDDPGAAMAEVRRVLKPGGAALISLHQYTSHSGSHDPELMYQDPITPPFWPHLRSSLAHSVHPSTYLNKLSLADWHSLFDKHFPGARILYQQQESLVEPLARLREQGELSDYKDAELLAINVIGLWQKGSTQKGPSDPIITWVP